MSNFYTPANIYQKFVQIAKNKMDLSVIKLAYLSLLGGIFFSIGLSVLHLQNGIFFMPIGFILILTCGGELFTFDQLLIIGTFNKEIRFIQILKIWIITYLFNILGIIMTVKLFNLAKLNNIEFVTNLPYNIVFVRSILGGIIIGLIFWAALTIKDTGKIFIIWMLSIILVLSKFNHCLQDIYNLSVYLINNNSFSINYIYSIIISTFGNIFGIFIFLSLMYHKIFQIEKK